VIFISKYLTIWIGVFNRYGYNIEDIGLNRSNHLNTSCPQ